MADDPSDCLIAAVRNGDIAKARALIETFGLSYSTAWSDGYELLCDALQNIHSEMAKMLLMIGAKVNSETRPKCRDTPLHIAVLHEYTQIVSILLEKNADVNALDYANRTPLHYAIARNNLGIVKLLIESNGFIDAPMEPGVTKLYSALESGNLKIVKELLNHGKWIDKNCTPLHLAAFEQNESRVELLLNEGSDINAKMTGGKTPLHSASIFPDEKVVKLLLKRGANVDAEDVYGATALHFAAIFGRTEVLKVLLNNNANVDALQEDENTPLHYAVLENHPTVVNMLLDSGADINAMNDKGSTPLYIASSRGHYDIVNILAVRNANMDADGHYLRSPIHAATKAGHYDVVETLLTLGATIDAQTGNGKTALHVAAEFSYPSIALILLDYGADINIICDYNSKTPFDYANSGIKQAQSMVYMPYVRDQLFPASENVAEILEQHILELIALNLYVSEANFKAINLYYKARNINGNPQTEVATMKTKNIGNSTVTFYDVLIGNINQLVNYARNESIVEALDSIQLIEDFPLYASMITWNIKDGQERKNLFESSLKSLSSLFGRIVPNIFAIELFTYLSNTNLKNLIKAYPSNDGCDT